MEHPRPAALGGLDHVGLTVPDLDAAVDFYARAFGARQLYRMGPFDARELPRGADGRDWTDAHVNVPDARLRIAMLDLDGGARLELFQYDRPVDRATTPPRNSDLGGHHIAFATTDLAGMVAHLAACGATPLAGPIEVDGHDTPLGHVAAQRVHYVLDPWGNQLELISYPEGR